MNENQVKQRIEELRQMAAKTRNDEDHKKLQKAADDLEACMRRMMAKGGFFF